MFFFRIFLEFFGVCVFSFMMIGVFVLPNDKSFAGGIGFLFFLFFPFLYAGYRIKNKIRYSTKKAEKIIEETRNHYSALKRNIDNSVIRNDYGAIIKSNTFDKITEFLLSVGFSEKDAEDSYFHSIVLQEVNELYNAKKESGFDPDSIPNEGLEFEGWVAENLRHFGWQAKATVGTGDQGVDVIAEKNGKKVGLQCKLYNSTVGNKAVQEIISAREYFDFEYAAVITNSSYTKSAKQLAHKSGVFLLTHYDLPDLDRIIRLN